MSRVQMCVTIALAALAGFAGGVRAQEYAWGREFTGRSFAVVDHAGHKRGEMAVGPDAEPFIRLYDDRGRVIWSNEGGVFRVVPAR